MMKILAKVYSTQGSIENDKTDEKPLPKKVQVFDIDKDEETSMNYTRWNQNDMVIDHNFAHNVELDIIHGNAYYEL